MTATSLRFAGRCSTRVRRGGRGGGRAVVGGQRIAGRRRGRARGDRQRGVARHHRRSWHQRRTRGARTRPTTARSSVLDCRLAGQREPVCDADEPCPACGALTWERVTPTDDSRGTHRQTGGPMRPTAVLVCTRCGHEISEGGWYGPGHSTALPWPRCARSETGGAGARRDAVLGLPATDQLAFPVYALLGAGAEASGHGWDREGVHSLTVRQDGVEITTPNRWTGGTRVQRGPRAPHQRSSTCRRRSRRPRRPLRRGTTGRRRARGLHRPPRPSGLGRRRRYRL